MAEQSALIPEKEVDVTFVDFDQNLKIPKDLLVYKARELQVVIEKYKKILQTTPNAFNMTSYNKALDSYIETVDALKKGKTVDELLDSGKVEKSGDSSTTSPVGEGDAPSVDPGISSDNPITG